MRHLWLALALYTSALASPSWPQFRGPNCAGVSDGEKPPIEFGPETNLLWKVAVPKGVSSPCIWDNRIFLTALEDNKLVTLGLDRRNGKVLWRQVAPAEAIEATHPEGSPASATPATDGKGVYAYFGSYGLVAYDLAGRELWRKPLPITTVINGSGTSPALIKDRLILNCDQQDNKSFLIAVDPRTGKTIWETPRPGFLSGYTTPILWGDDLVVAGGLRVVGYGADDGKEHWSARGLEAISVAPTPVLGDGQCYVMSRALGGSKMPTLAEMLAKTDANGDGKMSWDEAPAYLRDHGGFKAGDANHDGQIDETEWNRMTTLIASGEHGIFALRTPGSGDITATHVAWKNKRGVAPVASPLFYRGRIYVVQDGGRVTAYSPKTGDTFFEQERLNADGEYYASPIAANGHVYFASTRGIVTIITPADTMEVKARNRIGERIQATPAIVDNKLYVRTESHLWAFGEKR
ncbi:MAG TPA: PQQ-binding-like beta-propeller repeat protein [Candidatus Binatia bacterium]|nr:PQQ-binding-like beta-propeller repeat protein [Candidatus Binatia bacterium]